MRRKHKYMIAALAMGMCVSGISGSTVSAQKQQAAEAAESAVSEEELAYQDFLKDPENYSDEKDLEELMYAVYDVDQADLKELIFRGKTADEGKYRYSFYHYKDGEVKLTGSMEVWQDSGDGKLYYAKEENGIVLSMELEDNKAYSLYQIGEQISCGFTMHRQKSGTDEKYQYSLTDENGKNIDEKITEKEWNQFEEELTEIPFSDVISSEKSDGNADEAAEHKEADADDLSAGQEQSRQADIEMSEDAEVQASEEGELQGGISPVVNNNADAVNVVSQVNGMNYIGNQSYVRSLHRNEDNSSTLIPEMRSGILAAFPEDFDGDGKPEIFSVVYDGRVHFLMLRRAGESWEITSDQEIVTSSEYNVFDYSSLDERCVSEEDSVFFRKYNGSYEFYYEAYDNGVIADGQEWFFKGFRLEDGKLNPVDATSNLYFSGSQIDMFWENIDGTAGDSIDKFCSLGFASPQVHMGNMTVDSNPGLYPILRMTKGTACSPSGIRQWMADPSEDIHDGFTCMIEDKTGEVPEQREEFSSSQETQPAQQPVNSPFYGIWCYGTKEESEADSYAESLKASGFDARVFVTTDWSNLNTEKFYVVTAGVYAVESDANAALASVQSVYPDAYVKYSGDFQG